MTDPIFHIADAALWDDAVAAGAYEQSTRGQTLAEVGFIHCSYAHQVQSVADVIYKDAPGPLVLLTIDPDRVMSAIQVDDDFPHIYGPLNADAVTEVRPFHVS